MTWNPLRITNVWVKVSYILAWWVVAAVLLRFVFGWAPLWFTTPFGVIWDAAWLIVGTRSFRVAGEPVAPPRPWWQATGRPKASFWIGVLATIGFLSFATNLTTQPDLVVLAVFSMVEYALIAAFYFHSGIRLGRHPRAAPRPNPKTDLGAPMPKARGPLF